MKSTLIWIKYETNKAISIINNNPCVTSIICALTTACEGVSYQKHFQLRHMWIECNGPSIYIYIATLVEKGCNYQNL